VYHVDFVPCHPNTAAPLLITDRDAFRNAVCEAAGGEVRTQTL
jgi:hypothetical protein